MTEDKNAKESVEHYNFLCKEIERTEKQLARLYERQEKMSATGVDRESATWKNLKYDIQLAERALEEYKAEAAEMATSGAVGASSTMQMNSMASGAKATAGWLGRAAKTVGSKLLSGLKKAASFMSRMLFHSRSMDKSFSSMSSMLRRLAPSLLMTEGIFGALRKAVSSYMEANEQLAATLDACWSGIGNILGPIIERLVTLVSYAVSYTLQFLSLFGVVGKSTTQAIGAAGSAAKKETDKLKRQLASFDELNILHDNSSDSSGSSGSVDAPTAVLPEVTLPNWVQQMVDQLKAHDWTAAAETLTAELNNMIATVDWAGVGQKFGYYLNGALTFLATAITTFDWYGLGEGLATFLNNIIYEVDWANLGIVLGWKFIALIEGLGGFFAELDWDALGKALSDAFMGLWDAIDWKQAAQTLNDAVKGILTALTSAVANTDWQQIGRDIETFISAIDWSGVISSLSNLLASIWSAIDREKINSGIQSLFNAITTAIANIDWLQIGRDIGAFISQIDWASIIQAITAACAALVAMFFGLLASMLSDLDWIIDIGKAIIDGLLSGISSAIKGIGNWIKEHIFNPFMEGFKAAYGINSPSKVMEEQGGYVIEGLLNGIKDAFEDVVDWVIDSIGSLCNDMKKSWEEAKTNAKEAWDSMSENIKGKLTDIKDTASEKFSSITNTLSEKVSSMKTSVSNGFSDIKEKMTSKMQEAKSMIEGQSWSSVGQGICDGIASGLNKGWRWLKTTVGNLASSLLDKAKDVLDIHSPSGLFKKDVGLNIGYGIGEGIEASGASVLRSLNSVTGDIAKRVVFTMPAITGSIAPYKASAVANGAGNDFEDVMSWSNGELIAALIQMFNNSTAAVIRAIEEFSGTTINLDANSLTDVIINEINRRTRANGKTPLLI